MEEIKLYNVTEVASILKVDRRTVMNYIKSKELKAKKVGGKWLITEENLKEFVGA